MDNLSPIVIIVVVVLVLAFVAYVIRPIRERVREIAVNVGEVIRIHLGLGPQQPEGQYFALPRGISLTETDTDCMLWMAIEPKLKYPVCRHAAVTHAAGSAVAHLVTRSMVSDVSYLIDLFDASGGQVGIESDSNTDRLEEYLYELIELRKALARIVRTTHPNDDDPGQPGLVAQVFTKLPQGRRTVAEQIRPIYEQLKKRIEAMHTLLKDAALGNAENSDTETKIERMYQKTQEEMGACKKRLRKVLTDISSVGSATKDDWERDLAEIWTRECKPTEQRQCGCFSRPGVVL